MAATRPHFTFRIDTWTPNGESIVKHVAGVEDYQLALATFRAAFSGAISASASVCVTSATARTMSSRAMFGG